MEFFRNIRLKIGKLILAKNVARNKRVVYYSNFKTVRNIGIVWDATRPAEFTCLNRFHQKMQDLKIDVTILGYYPGKDLPDQYTAIRYLRCIKNNEVNSFYHPYSSETRSFINNQFDILIDINFEKLIPLLYLTSLSRARLKVGLSDNSTAESPFDLMLEIKKPVDIDTYLVQVIQYLEMIKDD